MRNSEKGDGIVTLADPFIVITEQGKGQAVFLAELLVGIDGISIDPEDGNAAFGEFSIVIAVAAELRGADRRIVRGVKDKKNPFAGESRKRDLVTF